MVKIHIAISTYTNFYKKNDYNLYKYIISLITRDKAIRNNNFKLNFLFSVVFLNYL